MIASLPTSWRGGAWMLDVNILRWFSCTWPFARMEVRPDRIIVSIFWKKYVFPRSAIRCLRRFRGVISTGIKIEHDNPKAPRFVVFWPVRFTVLTNDLETLGYHVTGAETASPPNGADTRHKG
jgi:hypothetical protein